MPRDQRGGSSAGGSNRRTRYMMASPGTQVCCFEGGGGTLRQARLKGHAATLSFGQRRKAEFVSRLPTFSCRTIRPLLLLPKPMRSASALGLVEDVIAWAGRSCPPRGLHVFMVIRLVQDAVAQVLIFMLPLAAELYDALCDHLTGFDRAIRDLKGRTNIVERVRHGSRRVRSELATITEHLRLRASASAAASWGRRSRASEPLPVSISTNSAAISIPSVSVNLASAVRCASRPSPDL